MRDNRPAALSNCSRCPRLVEHHALIREQYPEYHAAPVGSWGDAKPKILIVGLAPGLHGAARTGQAFVGDASGHFLFAALHRAGLATHDDPTQARLQSTRITNVVKCLPPSNAPIAAEINACGSHLATELSRYFPSNARVPRVLLTLGGVAHKVICRQLNVPKAKFGHGNVYQLSRKLHILSSFHPSRLNVNTGRITPAMFDDVLTTAKTLAVV